MPMPKIGGIAEQTTYMRFTKMEMFEAGLALAAKLLKAEGRIDSVVYATESGLANVRLGKELERIRQNQVKRQRALAQVLKSRSAQPENKPGH